MFIFIHMVSLFGSLLRKHMSSHWNRASKENVADEPASQEEVKVYYGKQ